MDNVTRAGGGLFASWFAQPRAERSQAPGAPVATPAAPPSWQDAFSSAPTQPVSQASSSPKLSLRQDAQAAEARVLATAAHHAGSSDESSSLSADYAAWRAAVQALVRAGELDAPEVKSFASKSQQMALLQQNLSPEVLGLAGPALRTAVEKELATLYTEPKDVIADNPLLLHPELARAPSLEAAKARGVPTTSLVQNGEKAEVRSDVVMVFCPGVVRLGNEFKSQREAALKAGFASVVADTGSFNGAELNAQVIADAVRDAKTQVGNPDAKVILVGYSQGATNILAFMRDAQNAWGALRGDVAGIEMMHPASGGSQLADLAVALGRYLFEDEEPSAEDMKLLRAYYRAKAELLGLPEQAAEVNEAANSALRAVLRGIRSTWGVVDSLLEKVGIDLPGADIRQHLVSWMMQHKNLPQELRARGFLGQQLADKLEPVWDRLSRAYGNAVLSNPEVNGFIGAYLDGGLKSLTTDYAKSLTSDPQLKENLAGIPILNSVGSVPRERLDSLVPDSQKLNMAFFKQLGLESDYQVSVPNEQLEPRLPTAVDLPTEAVGHWGVAGLVVGDDHPKALFKDFSPDGLVRSVLTTFGAMGVI